MKDRKKERKKERQGKRRKIRKKETRSEKKESWLIEVKITTKSMGKIGTRKRRSKKNELNVLTFLSPWSNYNIVFFPFRQKALKAEQLADLNKKKEKEKVNIMDHIRKSQYYDFQMV